MNHSRESQVWLPDGMLQEIYVKLGESVPDDDGWVSKYRLALCLQKALDIINGKEER